MSTATTQAVEALIASLKDPAQTNCSDVMQEFTLHAAGTDPDQRIPLELCRRFVVTLLDVEAPFLAAEAASMALKLWPEDRELERARAGALVESKALSRAIDFLKEVLQRNEGDQEFLGRLARAYKDWGLASAGEKRAERLNEAIRIYRAVFEEHQTHWHGINLATVNLINGDDRAAYETAAKVAKICRVKLEGTQPGSSDTYWLFATLGEAAIIQRKLTEARDHYREAVELAQLNRLPLRDLNSTRRQAMLLARHLRDAGEIEDETVQSIRRCFPVPFVAMHVGHMIDQPNRTEPRFMPAMEAGVKRRLLELLPEDGPLFGYSAPACGADILFLEAVQERGGATYVVLPYDREQFKRDCVSFAGADWGERFDQVMTNATEIIEGSRHRRTMSVVALDYANRLITGMAVQHADRLDVRPKPIAVWDGVPGAGIGGTALQVNWWEQGLNLRVKKPHPDFSKGEVVNESPAARPQMGLGDGSEGQQIRAILFGDVRNFSKLYEEEVPNFVESFYYPICAVASVSPDRPIVMETRGDGFFFAFDDLGKAGRFALSLRDRLRGIAWEAHGLPKDISLRMGLHAGPILSLLCPFTRRETFYGQHVNYAARLEPCALPGEIYTTREYAALVAAEGISEFRIEPVGRVPLPKQYG
ncbi:MAG: TRAFs-binding domain-containing protein, partial [Limisphaerales bacterium]